MIRFTPLQAKWTPLPWDLGYQSVALWGALEKWEGTPYLSGQRQRGAGADCIGSVFGVIDDIDGRQRASSPLLPADTALHDPASARRAVATLRRLYAPAERLRGEALRFLQPGDILVVGTAGGGPGHLMIVGTMPNTLWHAGPTGFVRTGWGFGTGFDHLIAAYRLGDRHRWSVPV